MIRRTMLFIPGNNAGMIQSADVFGADCLIIDLEDSVSLDEKDSARELLSQAFKQVKYENSEVLVRINPFDTPFYEDDLKVIFNLPIDAILLPKADLHSITDLARRLDHLGSKIQIFALIETTIGVEQVYAVLNSTNRCLGLMLGGEDLCVDLNCERTKLGTELLYARSRVVNAAKALKKIVIDTPFTDTLDDLGLEGDARFAKGLGFDGKAAINPKQIEIINAVFSPSEKEIKQAGRIIDAKNRASSQGLGVFSLDGKMIDLPIIKRAEKVLSTAMKIGLVENEGLL